jgi:drug/metabolite transporter (DMT)-like permease
VNKNPVSIKAKSALLGACIFWAASFIATKAALPIIPPLTIVTLRLLISSVCFFIWIIITGRRIKISGIGWLGKLALLSLFGTGLHYSIQTIGLQYTTASNASLYAVTGPISITIIAAIFLGEKITLKKGVGIFIAMTGVLIVTGLDTIMQFELKGRLLGDILVFASIFMWGIFTVMSKDMTKKMNPVEMTALVTFIGTLTMLPVGWFEIQLKDFSLASISLEGWMAVAFLGITCSFLATMLYVYALEQAESQKVGVYLYSIPPMTYIIAGIYLNEIIGLNLIFGSCIVLIGIYLTEKG